MLAPDRIAQLDAATPVSRERFVDLLRALSILVVVFGHWLLAVVTWRGGMPEGQNALAVVDGTWALTWVLQVMPLFFFVGGFSNLTAWRAAQRRGQGYGSFVATRLRRIGIPTAVMVGVWIFMAGVMVAAGVPTQRVAILLALIAKPLWFIAVYTLIIAIGPMMIAVHRRWGWRAPIALTVAAATVDLAVKAGGIGSVGVLNYAFVWLVPHQLGFAYADGSLLRWSRARFTALASIGFGTLVVMTASGTYAPSMVGVPGAASSNNSPPTLALVALSAWLIGIAMLARPAATRMLARPRVWAAVVGVNMIIMTAYLWHQTALVLGALVLLPVGFPQPAAGSVAWWATRPLWLGLLGLILAVAVKGFSRLERVR